ncbi:hypothetical protein [Streptomyces sp. Wb2n-11]|uniref:hypothetical protein n=1 Tax=Streptomyces sp. Wb2n-11 TaxID=1030533 RepID=UPI000A9EC273|nr:hypothetical protein [Streptomyces sp. Wb2n-11]
MSVFHSRRAFLALTDGALALTRCGAGSDNGGPRADGMGKSRRCGRFRALPTGDGDRSTIGPPAEVWAVDMAEPSPPATGSGEAK